MGPCYTLAHTRATIATYIQTSYTEQYKQNQATKTVPQSPSFTVKNICICLIPYAFTVASSSSTLTSF